MSTPDLNSSPEKNASQKIALGFCVALGIFGLAYLPPPGEYGRVFPYVLAVTLIPFSAIILSIVPSTRKFGLGLLLGCGIIWLAMLAICGGAFR